MFGVSSESSQNPEAQPPATRREKGNRNAWGRLKPLCGSSGTVMEHKRKWKKFTWQWQGPGGTNKRTGKNNHTCKREKPIYSCQNASLCLTHPRELHAIHLPSLLRRLITTPETSDTKTSDFISDFNFYPLSN